MKWFNSSTNVRDTISDYSDNEYYASSPPNYTELDDKIIEIGNRRKEIHDKYNQVAKETVQELKGYRFHINKGNNH